MSYLTVHAHGTACARMRSHVLQFALCDGGSCDLQPKLATLILRLSVLHAQRLPFTSVLPERAATPE